MGDSWESEGSFARVGELVGEAFLRYLELDTIMIDVIYLEGEKQAYFREYGMLEGENSWVFYRDFVWLVTSLGTHI